jgi:hypothetical protein
VKRIELRPAFTWDCDDCGQENFVRGVVPEMSEEDHKFMMEEHGLMPWECGDFITNPAIVTCCHCQTEFKAKHFRADEINGSDDDTEED